MWKGVIAFLKGGGRIVGATVIKTLGFITQKLRVITSRGILRLREAKAAEMRIQYARRGIFRWAPQLKAWLSDRAYRSWLGTLQMTLKDFYPMI